MLALFIFLLTGIRNYEAAESCSTISFTEGDLAPLSIFSTDPSAVNTVYRLDTAPPTGSELKVEVQKGRSLNTTAHCPADCVFQLITYFTTDFTINEPSNYLYIDPQYVAFVPYPFVRDDSVEPVTCAKAAGYCGATIPIYRYYKFTWKGISHAYSYSQVHEIPGYTQERDPLCYIWPEAVASITTAGPAMNPTQNPAPPDSCGIALTPAELVPLRVYDNLQWGPMRDHYYTTQPSNASDLVGYVPMDLPMGFVSPVNNSKCGCLVELSQMYDNQTGMFARMDHKLADLRSEQNRIYEFYQPTGEKIYCVSEPRCGASIPIYKHYHYFDFDSILTTSPDYMMYSYLYPYVPLCYVWNVTQGVPVNQNFTASTITGQPTVTGVTSQPTGSTVNATSITGVTGTLTGVTGPSTGLTGITGSQPTFAPSVQTFAPTGVTAGVTGISGIMPSSQPTATAMNPGVTGATGPLTGATGPTSGALSGLTGMVTGVTGVPAGVTGSPGNVPTLQPNVTVQNPVVTGVTGAPTGGAGPTQPTIAPTSVMGLTGMVTGVTGAPTGVTGSIGNQPTSAPNVTAQPFGVTGVTGAPTGGTGPTMGLNPTQPILAPSVTGLTGIATGATGAPTGVTGVTGATGITGSVPISLLNITVQTFGVTGVTGAPTGGTGPTLGLNPTQPTIGPSVTGLTGMVTGATGLPTGATGATGPIGNQPTFAPNIVPQTLGATGLTGAPTGLPTISSGSIIPNINPTKAPLLVNPTSQIPIVTTGGGPTISVNPGLVTFSGANPTVQSALTTNGFAAPPTGVTGTVQPPLAVNTLAPRGPNGLTGPTAPAITWNTGGFLGLTNPTLAAVTSVPNGLGLVTAGPPTLGVANGVTQLATSLPALFTGQPTFPPGFSPVSAQFPAQPRIVTGVPSSPPTLAPLVTLPQGTVANPMTATPLPNINGLLPTGVPATSQVMPMFLGLARNTTVAPGLPWGLITLAPLFPFPEAVTVQNNSQATAGLNLVPNLFTTTTVGPIVIGNVSQQVTGTPKPLDILITAAAGLPFAPNIPAIPTLSPANTSVAPSSGLTSVPVLVPSMALGPPPTLGNLLVPAMNSTTTMNPLNALTMFPMQPNTT